MNNNDRIVVIPHVFDTGDNFMKKEDTNNAKHQNTRQQEEDR